MEQLSRQDFIRSKGFDITDSRQTEFGKIKINAKTLDDAVLNLGAIQKSTRDVINKAVIYRALMENDIVKLREISNYFYKSSGIYQKVCNTAATTYRYDWYVVPEVYEEKAKPGETLINMANPEKPNKTDKVNEKILTDFNKVLTYLDNSYVSKVCADIALAVVKNGAYYGYVVDSPKGVIIQELPINYCRSRFSRGNLPAVEFNMKFFD